MSKWWLSPAANRDKFKALQGGDSEEQSRRLRALGLRETKALSSTVPKPGENALLCTLMCLNNLIKRGGTGWTKQPSTLQENFKI